MGAGFNLESNVIFQVEKVYSFFEKVYSLHVVVFHFQRGHSSMAKKPHGRRPPLPPLPCALPYEAAGPWSPATTAAARELGLGLG